MTDLLSLLRDADPATRLPEADAPPPRDVLDRIVATPAPRRRRAQRRLMLGAGAVATAVAVVLVVAPGDRGDLAARAYAATAPGDGVLYTELSTVEARPGRVERGTTRIWQRGDRSRRIRIVAQDDGGSLVYDYVQDDGALVARLPEGDIQVVRAGDGEEAAAIVEHERTSFVDTFRARYADAVLRASGRTEFAGRTAVAYEVEPRAPGSRETYYLDAENGMPLGSLTVFQIYEPLTSTRDGLVRPGRPTGEVRFTEVVRRIDRLPPTRANLDRLIAPWSPEPQAPRTPSPTGQETPVPPSPQ